MNANTVSGYYTSIPSGFVSDNGTHWVFNPQVDTGFVTIYFNHTLGACSGTDERTVYISPYPDASLGNDTLFCKNYFGTDSIRLDSTSASYQWSFRSNDSLLFYTDIKDTLHHINADSAGDYAVVIVNEFGCSSSDTMNITERPIIDLTFDSSNGDTLCYGETTALSIVNIDPTDPVFSSV